MMHTRMCAISTDKYSVLGQETVGIQDPLGTQSKVMNNDMQYAFVTALLDQLEDHGTNANEQCRRVRTRHYLAKPHIEAKTSLEFKVNRLWHISSLQDIILTTPIDNDMKIILTHIGHGECVYL